MSEIHVAGPARLADRVHEDVDVPGPRILLGYDASPGAERAAALLESRDWPDGTTIRVVSIPTRVGVPLSAFARLSEARAHARRTGEILLRAQGDLLADLDAAGMQVDGVLLPGPAATTIIDEADRFGADLIAIGSRGHGPLKSLFLGSTSAHIGDRASCSVLVGREATCRRALLVVDGSLGPEHALALSAYPAMLAGARISVLGVSPEAAEYPRIAVSDAEMLTAFSESESEAGSRTEEAVERLVERLGEAGLAADVEMCAGDLVPTVIATAAAWRADLVVMAAEPEPTPTTLLLGTVANRVLRGVTASVLIVRPRDPVTLDRPS